MGIGNKIDRRSSIHPFYCDSEVWMESMGVMKTSRRTEDTYLIRIEFDSHKLDLILLPCAAHTFHFILESIRFDYSIAMLHLFTKRKWCVYVVIHSSSLWLYCLLWNIYEWMKICNKIIPPYSEGRVTVEVEVASKEKKSKPKPCHRTHFLPFFTSYWLIELLYFFLTFFFVGNKCKSNISINACARV